MVLPYYILQQHLGTRITYEQIDSTTTNYETGQTTKVKVTKRIDAILLTNKAKYVFNKTREVDTYDLRIITPQKLIKGDKLIIKGETYIVKGFTEYDQYKAFVVYLELSI